MHLSYSLSSTVWASAATGAVSVAGEPVGGLPRVAAVRRHVALGE